MEKKKIYIEGDGCNRRMLEKTKIVEYLKRNDYTFVSQPGSADYILLVTCAFKEKEENHSLSRLETLKRYQGKLLIYGCLPDISPGKMGPMAGVKTLAPREIEKIDDFFHDIHLKYAELPDTHWINYYDKVNLSGKVKKKLFSNALRTKEHYSDLLASVREHLAHLFLHRRKEYYLYVCRGCLGNCAYCAIRKAIGTVKSKPLAEIMDHFRKGVEAGYGRFILLGDDLGCYGLDINKTLPDLMNSLLEESQALSKEEASNGAKKLRIDFHFKEIHFKYLVRYEDPLADSLRSEKVKSLLCPVQSGSDRILDLMKREHTAGEARRIIQTIRLINPNIHLSTQVIVGFPSETDQDFSATMDLLGESAFDDVILFPYHEKKGTPAEKIEGKVPEEVIQTRLREALHFLRRRGIKARKRCPL